MSYLSLNISHLRKSRKLTQAQLASALGIGRTNISNWEKEVSSPNLDQVQKMANYFGITVDELMSAELQKSNKIGKEKPPDQRDKMSPNLSHLSSENVTYRPHNKVDTTKPGHVSEPGIGGYQVERGDVIGEWKILLPDQATRVRIFTVSGTSMFPTLRNGDILICIPVTLGDIEDGKVYVIIDKSLSISAKHAYRFPGGLLMIPANREEYRPIVVEEKDIVEVWKALHRLTSDIPEFGQSAPAGDLEKKIDQLEHFIRKMFPDFGDVEGDFGK